LITPAGSLDSRSNSFAFICFSSPLVASSLLQICY
jgi:hypothetical protein